MRLGKLDVELKQWAVTGNAILGIRGSGKTYTATYLAEQLLEAGVPFVAFDPIGVWRYLRVPREGGKGYPVVVAGGQAADLPLTPESAPAIVEAAMKHGISLVIDLFDINLSKADWRRIVMKCVRLLLHENARYGRRHVFIEEAAEFIPQKVLDGHVFAEIEKLARMGGNARLGYTLINQRAEEVAKSVLELCENMLLHRQRGKNSLTALQKWLAISDVDPKKIIASLPNLPTGEFWAWIGGDEKPVHVKLGQKSSYHPDRHATDDEVDTGARPGGIEVVDFVRKLQGELAPKPKPEAPVKAAEKMHPEDQAAQDQMDEMRAFLKQQQEQHARKVAEAYEAGLAEGARRERAVLIEIMRAARARVLERQESLAQELRGLDAEIELRSKPETVAKPPIDLMAELAEKQVVTIHPPDVSPETARALTEVAAHAVREKSKKPIDERLLSAAKDLYPALLTWRQLAECTGRRGWGGSFETRRRGLIDAGLMRTDDAGHAVPTQPRPSGKPVTTPLEMLQHNFGLGEAARKMLDAIVKSGGLSKEEIGEACGLIARGGYFETALRSLKDGEIILLSFGRYTLHAGFHQRVT